MTTGQKLTASLVQKYAYGPSINSGQIADRRDDAMRLSFAVDFDRLNHSVFRFPAKFHPPVVRELIERFSGPGDTILDPFCGSGTTLVEALVAGRAAVGTDVDPLSVLVTRAKTETYDLHCLKALCEQLYEDLGRLREADQRVWGDFDQDITHADYAAAKLELSAYIPDIPNIEHWFRRRVVIQLAAVKARIDRHSSIREHLFLNLCFAAVIRNASNADPVPVSGLEVTKHMRNREREGRVIEPYNLLASTLKRSFEALQRFQQERAPRVLARVAEADIRYLSVRGTGLADCVITSPPYVTAVNYYRRHQLEMFWLGLTRTTADRLQLMARYLGRDRVSERQLSDLDRSSHGAKVAKRWLIGLAPMKPDRARAFVHYCVGMAEAFARLAEVTRNRKPIVIVAGDVRFNNQPISMAELISELAHPWLSLVEQFWYSLVNRYMSYDRRNGANIDMDHVLIYSSRS